MKHIHKTQLMCSQVAPAGLFSTTIQSWRPTATDWRCTHQKLKTEHGKKNVEWNSSCMH